ncbi:MAG: HAD hydrolase-like protein [Rhodothermales bacterium]|nr:HAD hydrolase-like protein [Rhodothermales bacterium]
MSVLLFDIDGTLLMAPGVGRRHFESALTALCGRRVSADGVAFAGRTDRSLAREMLERAGYTEEIENAITEVLDAYAARVEDDIQPEDVDILPGVRALLDELQDDPGLDLGVLTGNLERTGRAKLAAGALDDFFSFGAFGSDHEDRNELPFFARTRATSVLGRPVAFASLVIIGDTEHDVRCGHHVGARTVAVCTGNVDRESLLTAGPDLLLEDLTERQRLRQFLGR